MKLILAFIALTIATYRCFGITVYGTGDPSHNTTAPTGDLANSGWQYAGTWSGVTGWPIATNWFLAAKHIGGSVGDVFVLNGTNYTTIAVSNSPSSDLALWKVSGSMSPVASLYTKNDHIGKACVLIGRGTQRGNSVTCTNGDLVGWTYGPGDGLLRWGTNTVNDIGIYIGTLFSNSGGETCMATVGDSSGGLFIYDTLDSTWKLGGVISGVNEYTAYFRTICDHEQSETFASRVDTYLEWINEVTGLNNPIPGPGQNSGNQFVVPLAHGPVLGNSTLGKCSL